MAELYSNLLTSTYRFVYIEDIEKYHIDKPQENLKIFIFYMKKKRK